MKKSLEKIVAGKQLHPDDIKTLQQQGITTIICNRPDEEVDAEQHYASIKQAADKYNINTHYLPISNRADIPEVAPKLLEICKQPEQKIYAYCRSGTRSRMLIEHSLNLCDAEK